MCPCKAQIQTEIWRLGERRDTWEGCVYYSSLLCWFMPWWYLLLQGKMNIFWSVVVVLTMQAYCLQTIMKINSAEFYWTRIIACSNQNGTSADAVHDVHNWLNVRFFKKLTWFMGYFFLYRHNNWSLPHPNPFGLNRRTCSNNGWSNPQLKA